MPYSMTGFGSGEFENLDFFTRVDIKAVNHRYFEANARIPSDMIALEVKLISLIREKLQRGKIYCVVNIRKNKTDKPPIQVNWEALDSLFQILEKMKSKTNMEIAPINIENLLKIDGILDNTDLTEYMDSAWETVEKAAEIALINLEKMRESEGLSMAEDISNNLSNMIIAVKNIDKRRELVPMENRKKLEKRLEELMPELNIDPEKIAAEIAFLADKSDISEEIARLNSHFSAFSSLLKTKEKSCGKKMDFMCQELLREINTIGSKAQDTEIISQVLSAKSHLERIREQVQNIL